MEERERTLRVDVRSSEVGRTGGLESLAARGLMESLVVRALILPVKVV